MNRPKYPLTRDILGDLKATKFCLGSVGAQPERFFCFRGWKSPQRLYNRSNTKNTHTMLKHCWPPPDLLNLGFLHMKKESSGGSGTWKTYKTKGGPKLLFVER